MELRRDEAVDRRSDQLLRRVSQDALHGRVDRGEAPFEVERGDDVVGVVDEGAIALLALGQRPLRGFALGDVDGRSRRRDTGSRCAPSPVKKTPPLTSTHRTEPSGRTMRCSLLHDAGTARVEAGVSAQRTHALAVFGMDDWHDVAEAAVHLAPVRRWPSAPATTRPLAGRQIEAEDAELRGLGRQPQLVAAFLGRQSWPGAARRCRSR